jgi:hypothetical protein
VYALVPGLDDLTDGTYVTTAKGAWNLGGGAGIEPWLLGGWGPSRATPGAPPRVTGSTGGAVAAPPVANGRAISADGARALVPLLLPDGVHAKLWMLGPARARISWNGEQVVESHVPAAWTPIEFDVPSELVSVGMNTIEIEPAGGDVSVGKLELTFLPDR